MRAHEDGPATARLVQQKRVEGPLADRIEAAGRLIQDHQFGIAHEGLHEGDLLAHALRIPLQRTVNLHVEALDKVIEENRLQPLHP